MVHDSWLQTASIAVKALSLVRASRNRPAVDSTSAAPPTSASADPGTVTCTLEPLNQPARTGSIAAGALGDVDKPPQPENSVASVTQDATSQASEQNRHPERDLLVHDL